MAKTNSGLLAYAKKQVGKPYWYGTFGQTSTASLLAEKKKQYPTYYKATDYKNQLGQRVHDCAGLIKGYLWSATATSTPKYDAKTDWGAAGFYTHATKKGTIGTFPKYNGLLIFKADSKGKITHVAVYGDGCAWEAKGHAYGVVKTKYKASDWKYWCQCNLIENDIHPEPTPEPVPVPTPTPTPTPTVDTYMVKTNTGAPLALRAAPNTKAVCIVWIPNGSTVTVTNIVKGENIGGCDDWARTTYKGKTGYSLLKYLKKV